jgi:hypothetical protein
LRAFIVGEKGKDDIDDGDVAVDVAAAVGQCHLVDDGNDLGGLGFVV